MIPLTADARIDRANRLRRAAADGGPQTNGIVGVEVVQDGPDLVVDLALIFPLSADVALTTTDITISGGVRRPRISVTSLEAVGDLLRVHVGRRGDFSRYTVRISRDAAPVPGFDPLLSQIEVDFRRECDTGIDCRSEPIVSLEPLPTAAVDYTARDYHGFRRLMLDRLAVLMPDWQEPREASPEVTLIEMLAHAADRLAYAQDAVATESYLDTARLRTSAKRHAQLIDYTMHDGCAARAFVHIRMRSPDPGEAPVTARVHSGARFMTRTEGVPAAGTDGPTPQQARLDGAPVYEAMTDCDLTSAHNRIEIHDYAGALTSLPKGATSMAVADPDQVLGMAAGDLLLIEQVADPETGDAFPVLERRHVVRLTDVTEAVDPVGRLDEDGLPAPLSLLSLTWADADALPRELPVARVTTTDTIDGIEPGPGMPTLVARGNIVPADHGESAPEQVVVPIRRPGRRRVAIPLPSGPVTQSLPFPPDAPASRLRRADPAQARPVIRAHQTGGDGSLVPWDVVPDLLDSDPTQSHLVLDVETHAPTMLRSGDGRRGRLPESDIPMVVHYRVGNGSAGDIGAEALAHLLTDEVPGPDGTARPAFDGQADDVDLVRNPLPANGVDPESIAETLLRAPMMIEEQQRAVTGDDYVRFLRHHEWVADARAVEQWTGSWRVIVLLVDTVGGVPLDDDLETSLRVHLERYRLAGHALEFRDPVLVPLELSLRVCVEPRVPRSDVQVRLMQLLSGAVLPDGSLGLFHPDRFSFGDPVHLSHVIAAVQSQGGVRHVEVTGLGRMGSHTTTDALATGQLTLGTHEIPVLANDPNYPDRGTVRLTMEGGS